MTSNNPKRFVILHHRVGSGFGRTDQDHFDWMFETGQTLITFATPMIEDMHSNFQITCQLLPDHRIVYLDFEGSIPDRGELRDRGSVTRIASGSFEEITNSDDLFSAELLFSPTNKNTGSVEFKKCDQQWVLRYKSN
ncbi:hypothetical protein LF1_32950 [Rubripirellula obstinata]|uniref:Uncharacterized protein n=1 Tax=Rubripirellula obstinata TaxID=406547 RepID=A0A5B1CNA8_9BACT|nr:hypothetical protein [Rubripirellula obstinata]KAA1260754.1 hypothetical protein LF1_32950 [Rubripirellula obstinata]